MNWQPIETAPKGDGQDYVSLLFWDDCSQSVVIGQWWERGRYWISYEGDGCDPFKPTHWMPLPEPPK